MGMAFETHAIFALLRRRLKGGEERVTPYRQRRRRHTGPTRTVSRPSRRSGRSKAAVLRCCNTQAERSNSASILTELRQADRQDARNPSWGWMASVTLDRICETAIRHHHAEFDQPRIGEEAPWRARCGIEPHQPAI